MTEILEVGYAPQILEAIGPPSFPLLKRIIYGSDEVIHSLIFEFVNGERRGLSLDEKNEPVSVMDDSNIFQRIGTDWIDIEYGDYIVAISGFNSNRSNFLCHSVTLQFKSGSEVTIKSNKKMWRGEPFFFNVPPSKLVTNLVFLTNGTMPAVGVNTTSIHLPIEKENMPLLPNTYRERVIKLFMIFNRLWLPNETEDVHNNLLPFELGWEIVGYICAYNLSD